MRKAPSFLSTPVFDVGIPVFFANFCFAAVIPKALFHEKEKPNFPILMNYTTIFNSDGGGGSSFNPITSFPESSTLVEETPIDAVTQAKNLAIL